jgi:hypothetical protein
MNSLDIKYTFEAFSMPDEKAQALPRFQSHGSFLAILYAGGGSARRL